MRFEILFIGILDFSLFSLLCSLLLKNCFFSIFQGTLELSYHLPKGNLFAKLDSIRLRDCPCGLMDKVLVFGTRDAGSSPAGGTGWSNSPDPRLKKPTVSYVAHFVRSYFPTWGNLTRAVGNYFRFESYPGH